MKKKRGLLWVLLILVFLILVPQGRVSAASERIKSMQTIYQTTTVVKGKATPRRKVRLVLDGRKYWSKTKADGTYSFQVSRASIGSKAKVTVYSTKGKAVHSKTTTVKGNFAFQVLGYDKLNRAVTGKGMAGRKVKITIGSKTYTTTVKNDGTWSKTIPTIKTSKKVKVSQQVSGKTYSTPKTTTLKASSFDTTLLKKGSRYYHYYSSGYSSSPQHSWVGFQAKSVIGKKIYFQYTICQIKDGKGTPQTIEAVGTVMAKNKMKFETMGITAVFTWENAKTLTVTADATGFDPSMGIRTEILTAK